MAAWFVGMPYCPLVLKAPLQVCHGYVKTTGMSDISLIYIYIPQRKLWVSLWLQQRIFSTHRPDRKHFIESKGNIKKVQWNYPIILMNPQNYVQLQFAESEKNNSFLYLNVDMHSVKMEKLKMD